MINSDFLCKITLPFKRRDNLTFAKSYFNWLHFENAITLNSVDVIIIVLHKKRLSNSVI